MGTQTDIFTATEGNAWHQRNVEKPRDKDPVLKVIVDQAIVPKRVLEIGCGNGWRLDQMQKMFKGISVCGLDPSAQALADWRPKKRPNLKLQGNACYLPGPNDCFDLVIFGFCLYVCDREDLFRIVQESDRVLQDQGYLVIYDFFSEHPHARVYGHDDRLRSYKMDHARLWCAHPAYRVVEQRVFPADSPLSDEDRIAVTILKKDIAAGFPLLS